MNLQNMAPNARRSLILTVSAGLVAAGLYLFGVEPVELKLQQLKSSQATVSQQHAVMTRNLKGASKTQSRLDDCENRLAPFRKAMLQPVLESYGMGAKALLDPLALGAGLAEVEYEALSRRALPVPKRLPAQLHARLPVRVKCSGSYAAAVSFLLRVEKEFPLVSLESLLVEAQHDPDVQRIAFILEWPVPGVVTTPPAKGGPCK